MTLSYTKMTGNFPYLLVYCELRKGTPFERSLHIWPTIGSTPPPWIDSLPTTSLLLSIVMVRTQVCCVFILTISVYQTSKPKAKFRADENETKTQQKTKKILPCCAGHRLQSEPYLIQGSYSIFYAYKLRSLFWGKMH